MPNPSVTPAKAVPAVAPTITVASPKAFNACLIAPSVSTGLSSSFVAFFNNLNGGNPPTLVPDVAAFEALATSKAGELPPDPELLGRCTAAAGNAALDLAKKNGIARPAERTNFIRYEEARYKTSMGYLRLLRKQI